jgi:hypothetical protein
VGIAFGPRVTARQKGFSLQDRELIRRSYTRSVTGCVASESPTPEPYRSALDLPGVAEMLQQIRGGKVLTRFIARRVRPDLVRIEKNVRKLAGLVASFYALLGPRHWIFHENLSTEKIGPLVQLSVEEAERALIKIYKDSETLRFLIRMLMRFPQLQARMHLIERAHKDYVEGRYYSTVLVLLSVMDGFVNDFESKHRGLHARGEDEMHAWDSIVGHHLGLTNAHRTFTKSFSRTSDEEVHELYRNGILHGNLVNFDNDIVATKAWNRLFAVADWATSRRKQSMPVKPEPSFRELLAKIKENAEAKKALDEWRPRAITEEEPDFANEPLYLRTAEYLVAWREKNYGRMAEFLSSLVREDTHGPNCGNGPGGIHGVRSARLLCPPYRLSGQRRFARWMSIWSLEPRPKPPRCDGSGRVRTVWQPCPTNRVSGG